MKKACFLLALLTVCLSGFSREYVLLSPDGALRVVISDELEYTVSYGGKKIYTGVTALTLDNGKTLAKARSPKLKSVDTLVSSPFYRNTSVADKYNGMTLYVDKDWTVEFRAYDDGIAYHWVYGGRKSVNIVDETVRYTFAEDFDTFTPYVRDYWDGDFEKQFHNSFESIYQELPISHLSDTHLAFLPVAVDARDVKMLITESDIAGYPGLYLLHDKGTTIKGVHPRCPKSEHAGGYLGMQSVVSEREDYIAAITGARGLPWRMAIISPDDKGLAASQLTYLLASPSRIADISWIKPGKAAWDWWNSWDLTGVDFEAGVNQNTYKYYIDFAAKNGIEYVILDDGWSVPNCGDLFSVVPELDLPELIRYAEGKGVGIILWAMYLPFEKDLEKVCRHYSRMGVKGFKVDFFDRNDQKMTAFLDHAAEVAARYHLILDYHGTYMPAGINRKWPNVLNTEGVSGQEVMRAVTRERDQMRYDVLIPFIRQAGGPMDYTQGAMRNSTYQDFVSVERHAGSQGTRCHQLALYAIFDSPLNMLCDTPINYEREQECTDYIAAIPTVWDETVVLDGELGEYIVTARRKGDDWFIGGITNWTPRDITIDLSFLHVEDYVGDWYIDGCNAHRNATDYKRVKEDITAKKTIHLAPGGGFAVRITKK